MRTSFLFFDSLFPPPSRFGPRYREGDTPLDRSVTRGGRLRTFPSRYSGVPSPLLPFACAGFLGSAFRINASLFSLTRGVPIAAVSWVPPRFSFVSIAPCDGPPSSHLIQSPAGLMAFSFRSFDHFRFATASLPLAMSGLVFLFYVQTRRFPLRRGV